MRKRGVEIENESETHTISLQKYLYIVPPHECSTPTWLLCPPPPPQTQYPHMVTMFPPPPPLKTQCLHMVAMLPPKRHTVAMSAPPKCTVAMLPQMCTNTCSCSRTLQQQQQHMGHTQPLLHSVNRASG